MQKVVKAADLFCGAGGSSSGLASACASLNRGLDLIAINHWDVAIATHTKNHPGARHLCENLDNVDPTKLVKGGILDILIASPECTHHSNARGGRPMNDQGRASAWHILRWCERIRIKRVLIENVKEFETWGPLSAKGKPIKSRKGETFHAFLASLQSLGYTVDYRVINCAYYGDPTTRERLFVMARRDNRRIVWPEATHSPDGALTLFGPTKRFRTAREIINWKMPGKSIFNRKKSLSETTLKRIAAGMRKFNGIEFIIGAGGPEYAADPRSVDQPLKTVMTRSHMALCQPYIVKLNGTTEAHLQKHSAQSIDKPLPTVVGCGHLGVCQPFIVPFFGEREGQEPRCHSIDDPLPTVTGHGAGALIEPFIVEYHGNHAGRTDGEQRVHAVDEPLRTQDTSNRFAIAQPFLVDCNHGAEGPESHARRAHSVDKPLGAITTQRGKALVEPFLIDVNHGEVKSARQAHSVDKPLNTVTTKRGKALVEPFLMKFHGNGGGARSVDIPLDAITCRDRYGLVIPGLDGYRLDIRFRMLQPLELAKAMSFPESYVFEGTREAQVKQIGNAVPGETAKALCCALLSA